MSKVSGTQVAYEAPREGGISLKFQTVTGAYEAAEFRLTLDEAQVLVSRLTSAIASARAAAK